MLLKALLVLVIPVVALLGGVAVFKRLPEYNAVQSHVPSVTPLNQRLAGYSAKDANDYWQSLGADRASERHMLKVDLAFPVVYGAAFAVALLLAWSTLRWSFNPLWLLAPVILLVAADWTENLAQLGQLARLDAQVPLSAVWIGVASLATQVKLTMLVVCSILTVGSAGCLIEHYFA